MDTEENKNITPEVVAAEPKKEAVVPQKREGGSRGAPRGRGGNRSGGRSGGFSRPKPEFDQKIIDSP